MASPKRSQLLERIDMTQPRPAPGMTIPVIEVTPDKPVEVDVAFTLPPIAEEDAPPGATILPAGTLRHIKVDRKALESNRTAIETNAKLKDGQKPKDLKPTWEVREAKKGAKAERYYAFEIRGSVMCLNGEEDTSYEYGCSTYDGMAQTGFLATMAEIVAYTKPPAKGS